MSVSVVDASKMMNSGMWCTGICARRWRDLKTITNFLNMDTNGLHIVTYNSKNFTTDGDKFEFLKGLFKESQFLPLQELWLYESEFHNLLKLDKNCDFIATSSMNEYTQRAGRKYGGTAILWDASVKGSITKINFDNKRICGLIFKRIKISLMIINVYMP